VADDQRRAQRAKCGQSNATSACFTDISRLRNAEARAEFIAYHDALTRLPNRSLLNIRYEHALEGAASRPQAGAADPRPRPLQEHQRLAGARVRRPAAGGDHRTLQVASARRRHAGAPARRRIRGADGRYRGRADAAVVARDLLQVLEAPFRIGGADDIYIGASIGISISPDDGSDPALLMRNADTAVNLAKAQGRKTFCFYTESLTTLALERMSWSRACAGPSNSAIWSCITSR
jgi:GGDEF domain-containing protein